MAPFFTFFVDKRESGYVTPFIRKLDKYYPSFADSIYIEPRELKKRYAGANMKLFAYDGNEFIMFDLETVDLIEPLLALTMDSFTKMSRKCWIKVFKFLKALFEELEVPTDLVEDMKTIVPPVFKNPEKITITKALEAPKKENDEYEFQYTVENDICFAEVIKPFTDLPYTCVIRNYSEVGFEPLFTALYVCSSWGVTNYDHAFLEYLWKHLEMSGDLDLENRLKREIELCKNGKPEPEVYRLTIDEVKHNLSRKKKRAPEPIEFNKFVRV